MAILFLKRQKKKEELPFQIYKAIGFFVYNATLKKVSLFTCIRNNNEKLKSRVLKNELKNILDTFEVA